MRRTPSALRQFYVVQAETAAEKFMMRRTQEENGMLRSFLVRYQSLLADLQTMQMDLPDGAQRVTSNMHGVSSDASNLIESHSRLWEAYSSLPNTPRLSFGSLSGR